MDSDFTTGAWRGVIGWGMDIIVETLESALHDAYQSETINRSWKNRAGVQWRDAEAFGTYMEESDAAFGDIMKAIGLAK